MILGDVGSCSQATLDEEKLEVSVCTKAPEIIGRLTCVMWIYCNGNICTTILLYRYKLSYLVLINV